MTVFHGDGAWRISQERVLTRRRRQSRRWAQSRSYVPIKQERSLKNRMAVVSISSTDGRWDSHDDAAMSEDMRAVLDCAWLASARELPTRWTSPFIRSRWNSLHRIRPRVPSTSHSCIWIRPDMFAVANVIEGETGGDGRVCAKGALEAIAELCALSPERLAAIHKQADELASRGIRVLGVARSVGAGVKKGGPLPDTIRSFAFDYMGLIGFADPLRSERPRRRCGMPLSGIRVVMITGDYPPLRPPSDARRDSMRREYCRATTSKQ